MNKQILLKESLKFVNENPDCLFDKIPQHLIEFWRTDNFMNEDLKATDQWAIFMHILIFKKEVGVEFEIEIERFEKMKQNWQNILAIISANNLTEIKIKPFKIFDLENLENIEIIRTK